MDELIQINYEGEQPMVSGRDLHSALGISTQYSTWFKRMCEYGFAEGTDYETRYSNLDSEMHGSQNKVDHELTIPMAKELCMIQRTELGRKFRRYFIQVEEAWNTPELVMARALQFTKTIGIACISPCLRQILGVWIRILTGKLANVRGYAPA